MGVMGGPPRQNTWGAPGGWFRFVSFAATARTLGGTRPQRHNKSGGRSPTDQATNMGGGDFYLHLGPGLAETDIVSGHAASCNLGGNHGGCWDNREYFVVSYDNRSYNATLSPPCTRRTMAVCVTTKRSVRLAIIIVIIIIADAIYSDKGCFDRDHKKST